MRTYDKALPGAGQRIADATTEARGWLARPTKRLRHIDVGGAVLQLVAEYGRPHSDDQEHAS